MNASYNQQVIEEFRANEGKLGGPFEGGSMLLLTTTGARSGQPHTTPLMYRDEGDARYVFASMGGAPTNPAWYRNLVAQSSVTVEVGSEKYEATASSLDGAERDRVYAAQAEAVPMFGEYQRGTERVIPVVRLARA